MPLYKICLPVYSKKNYYNFWHFSVDPPPPPHPTPHPPFRTQAVKEPPQFLSLFLQKKLRGRLKKKKSPRNTLPHPRSGTKKSSARVVVIGFVLTRNKFYKNIINQYPLHSDALTVAPNIKMRLTYFVSKSEKCSC
jgi:hypothetical protein